MTNEEEYDRLISGMIEEAELTELTIRLVAYARKRLAAYGRSGPWGKTPSLYVVEAVGAFLDGKQASRYGRTLFHCIAVLIHAAVKKDCEP